MPPELGWVCCELGRQGLPQSCEPRTIRRLRRRLVRNIRPCVGAWKLPLVGAYHARNRPAENHRRPVACFVISPLMSDSTPLHVPVMLDEIVHWLEPRAGGVFVDGTLGGGG